MPSHTLQERLKKTGLRLFRQEGGRVFLGEPGAPNLHSGVREIRNPQSLGIDINTIQDIEATPEYQAGRFTPGYNPAFKTLLPGIDVSTSKENIESAGLEGVLKQYEEAQELARQADISRVSASQIAARTPTVGGGGATALNELLAARGLPPIQTVGPTGTFISPKGIATAVPPSRTAATVVTPTSVVDFLKSRGFQQTQGEQFPLFNLRKQLFEQAGLSPTKGEFRGFAEENRALASLLARAEAETGVAISPSNIGDVLRFGKTGGTAAGVVDLARGTTAPPSTPSDVSGVQGQVDTTGEASKVFADLFKTVSPEDLAQKALELFTGSATFPLEQEAREAEKAGIRVKAQQETEELIQKMASRGLTFSGIRAKGEATIEADQLSKLLGVDRKFALLIAKGLESSAQTIAKEAQQGKKDALGALEKLGYTVNPLTGRIEPTLAAIREGRLEEAALRSTEASERAAAAAERAASAEERSAAKFEAERKPFLNFAFLNTLFDESQWFDIAKEAGIQDKIADSNLRKNKTIVVQEYMNDLMKTIEAYRAGGFTDREIQALLFAKPK